MRLATALVILAFLGGTASAAEVSLDFRAGQGAALEARVDAIPLGPFTIAAGLGWGPAGWVALSAEVVQPLGPAGLLASAVEGVVGFDRSFWAQARARATLGPVDLAFRGHLANRPLAEIMKPLAGRPPGTDSIAHATASLGFDALWRVHRRLILEAGLEGQERSGISTLAVNVGLSFPHLLERGVTMGIAAGAGGPGGSWHAVLLITDRSGPAVTELVLGVGERSRHPPLVDHQPPILPGFQFSHILPLGESPALPGEPGVVAEATLAWLPWTRDRPLLAGFELRGTPGAGLHFRLGLETDTVSAAGRLSVSMAF